MTSIQLRPRSEGHLAGELQRRGRGRWWRHWRRYPPIRQRPLWFRALTRRGSASARSITVERQVLSIPVPCSRTVRDIQKPSRPGESRRRKAPRRDRKRHEAFLQDPRRRRRGRPRWLASTSRPCCGHRKPIRQQSNATQKRPATAKSAEWKRRWRRRAEGLAVLRQGHPHGVRQVRQRQRMGHFAIADQDTHRPRCAEKQLQCVFTDSERKRAIVFVHDADGQAGSLSHRHIDCADAGNRTSRRRKAPGAIQRRRFASSNGVAS